MYQVNVVVDTNDADYINCQSMFRDADIQKVREKILLPIHKIIESHGNKVKFCHEYLDDSSAEKLWVDTLGEDIYEFFFDNMCPYDDQGFHTIVSIEVLNIESIEHICGGTDAIKTFEKVDWL